ncbi:hypothetical protein OnM2_102026 [Erysiphe neolycopersici]|uniref:Transposase n=1 Tax=Erysiphe neolycopersici TaxID=212602 RepID=A0A420H8J0_9PEZI|nr:hypothetical protein OnM2_102026 [Erysiphe neolycopersici]
MSAFKYREKFNPENKDISNIIQKKRQKQRGGMTPLQWLLQELQLMHLHFKSLRLWKNIPKILLMDSTYLKKNRFNIPLSTCGVTSRHEIIQLGIFFMFSDKERDHDLILIKLKIIIAIEGVSVPLSF